MKRVLIVDDDINICNIIQKYFDKGGFDTQICLDGMNALEVFNQKQPDVIILDIMLPGIDGIQICKKIREKSNVPVIMLTARGETHDKIMGLNIGADDYLAKPFDPNELIARANAVLRRTVAPEKEKNVIRYSYLEIRTDSFEVKLENQKIEMPRKEFQLLEFLAANPNKVFSREKLIESIWGFDFEGEDRVIDLYIKRIRKRLAIKKENINWSIATVWGIGYKFEVKEDV